MPYFCDTGQVAGGGLPAGVALGAIVWLPPAAGPDPAVLAQQAVDSMRLRPLEVGLTPPAGAGTPTLVGLPVWMWVENPGPETYGPNTASATAGAVTVTATAKVSSVTWDMGDGTLVNCGQGTPYTPGHGAAASPSCGHRYERPGTYAITATSNWVVDWAGGGSVPAGRTPTRPATACSAAADHAVEESRV